MRPTPRRWSPRPRAPTSSTTASTRPITAGRPTGRRCTPRCSGPPRRTDSVLVMLGNLYGYGPVSGPMTEDLPLAGTSVKDGSGPRCGSRRWPPGSGSPRSADPTTSGRGRREAYLTMQVIRPVAEGRRAVVLTDPDVPHAWTYLPDVARALVIAGTDERAWGRPWHVPTSRGADLPGGRRPRRAADRGPAGPGRRRCPSGSSTPWAGPRRRSRRCGRPATSSTGRFVLGFLGFREDLRHDADPDRRGPGGVHRETAGMTRTWHNW